MMRLFQTIPKLIYESKELWEYAEFVLHFGQFQSDNLKKNVRNLQCAAHIVTNTHEKWHENWEKNIRNSLGELLIAVILLSWLTF